jgi:hypothetical protein
MFIYEVDEEQHQREEGHVTQYPTCHPMKLNMQTCVEQFDVYAQ